MLAPPGLGKNTLNTCPGAGQWPGPGTSSLWGIGEGSVKLSEGIEGRNPDSGQI